MSRNTLTKMAVPVSTSGDIDAFCQRAGIDRDELDDALSDLPGDLSAWALYVFAPDRWNPHGRVELDHDTFDEHTGIAIASSDKEPMSSARTPDSVPDGVTYSVVRPTGHDIITSLEGAAFDDAVSKAVEVADDELSRQQ